MQTNIFYVVEEPKSPTGLAIISLIDYMGSSCPDIVKPGSKEECETYMSQYSEANPYVKPTAVEQDKINEARKKSGKDLGNVPREYPLVTNGVLTEGEKTDILTKAFEDAGFLLHAALVYTGETRTIDANVLTKTGEKYILTFQRVKA